MPLDFDAIERRAAEMLWKDVASPAKAANPANGANGDDLLDRAREVLGWKDADCDAWLKDALRNAQWAVQALDELLAYVEAQQK